MNYREYSDKVRQELESTPEYRKRREDQINSMLETHDKFRLDITSKAKRKLVETVRHLKANVESKPIAYGTFPNAEVNWAKDLPNRIKQEQRNEKRQLDCPDCGGKLDYLPSQGGCTCYPASRA